MPTPCAKHCASHARACASTACTRPGPITPNNIYIYIYIYSQVYMPKWTRRQATTNINRVMRRACGHVLECTPLRVTSSACPRKHTMAYKAHTPPCVAHPHAQSQDEHRTNATSKDPSLSFKVEDASNASSQEPPSEPRRFTK